MRHTVFGMFPRERTLSHRALWANIGYVLTDPDCTITTGHKDEEQKDKREVCINDMLPDELLLVIFSHIPVLDLVGAVPVVCQRWKVLSRSKTAWRLAALVYCPLNEAPSGPSLEHESFLRVARRAPFLNLLDISNLLNHVGGKKIQQVFFTLLKTNCEVRHLVLGIVRHRALVLLLKLLIKYSPSLQSLCLQMHNRFVSLTVWSVEDNREVSILTCIRNMPQLRSYDMMSSFVSPELYDDEFLQGFRALKYLKWSSSSDDVEPLILDILENCHERLTAVTWTHALPYTEFPGSYQLVLSNCPNVRHLEMPWGCIGVINNMPYLETLSLDLTCCDAFVEEIENLGDFISNAKAISRVREMRLSLAHASSNRHLRYCPRIISVIKAVTRRCGAKSSLRVLHLIGQFKGRVLTEMFKKMPQLEELHFTWHEGLTVAHLKLIGKMPSLKFLEIEGLSAKLPAGEEEIRVILEGMTSSHPGLIFKLPTSVAVRLDIPNALLSLDDLDELKRHFETIVTAVDELKRQLSTMHESIPRILI